MERSALDSDSHLIHLKKKRALEGADKPSTKRTAAHVPDVVSSHSTLKEALRGQIHEVYTSYGKLLQGSDATAELQAFRGILDSAQGSCATRRLAARLLPRFIHKFPSFVDQSATVLTTLYQGDQTSESDVDAILQSTKIDALRGLGDVLDASVKLADKAVPTVMRIVDFLLRQLYQLTKNLGGLSSKPYTTNYRKWTAMPKYPEDWPSDGLGILQCLLEKAFRLFPRVVLSCCLQSFKKTDAALYQGAHWFCSNHLLCEPAPTGPANGASEHPAPGDMEHMGAAHQHSLAKDVLSQLPDTQQWLRQAIVSITKDKKILAAKEIHCHIDKLLKLIAPPPAPPPPPPPAQQQSPPPPPAEVAASASPVQQQQQAYRDGSGADQLQGQPSCANGMPVGTALLTPLAVRGGPITRADACLFMSNLPTLLSEPSLYQECSRHSTVESVHIGHNAGLLPGESYVVFTSVRDAAICFESMAGALPFGGSRQLHIEFSPGIPADCPTRQRKQLRPASNFIWVAGHNPQINPDSVCKVIMDVNLPSPQQILRVAGRAPGLLLDMASSAVCQPIVDCLLQRFAPDFTPPQIVIPLPSGQILPQGSMPAQMQGQTSLQQHGSSQPAASSSFPPHVHIQNHASGLLQSQASSQHTPGQQSTLSAASPGMQDPGPHVRTVWVGQVHDSVHEHEILTAFKKFGEVVSYRFLRSSHCAFIDYAHHSSAAEARSKLNGARFGQQPIRVEWKMDDRRSGPPARGMPPRPAGTPIQLQQQQPHLAGRSSPLQPAAPLSGDPAGAVAKAMLVRAGSAMLGMGGGMDMATGIRRSESWPTAGPSPLGQSHSSMYPPVSGGVPGFNQADGLAMAASGGMQPQYGSMSMLPDALPPLPSEPPPPPPASTPPLIPGMAPHMGGVPAQAAAMLHGGMMGMTPPLLSSQYSQGASQFQPHRQLWQGTLAKSGAHMCTLVCHDSPDRLAAPPPACQEPLGWPTSLDVRMRVDLQYVVYQMYPTVAQHLKAVRRLLPGTGGDDKAKLQEFITYLAEKGRAGVIKMDPVGASSSPRTLYLVPPSAAVCSSLAVDWDPREPMILALVVPTPAVR